MVLIQDPLKSRAAEVNEANRLKTATVTEKGIENSSETGDAFTFSSTYAATGGDEVIYMKNTSADNDFHIEKVLVANSVASNWIFFKVTSGTAAGTAITGQNLNTGSGKTASATAFGNASVTGSLAGDTLALASTPAGETRDISMEGSLIVGPNQEFALTASATGTVQVTLFGFFETVGI